MWKALVSKIARAASPLIATALLFLTGCSGDGSGGMGSGNYQDSAPPTVTFATPGSTVSRTVALSATASDDVGVTRVEFLVDGNVVGADSSAPYSIDWDTGPVADGQHSITVRASDAVGNTTTTAAAAVVVANNISLEVPVEAAQEIPATSSEASGNGTLMLNLATGAIAGTLAISGMTVTGAHIHEGYAGENGPVAVGLQADASSADTWRFEDGASLTAAQVTELLAGGLYLNAHSAAYPGGEIRGQIVPDGIEVGIAQLDGLQEVPAVDSAGAAQGGVTVDTVTGRVTIHLRSRNLADATQAHLHRGAGGTSGPVIVPLTQDGSDPAHWFAADQPIAQDAVDDLLAGGTYLNVHTPANPTGEVRGQVITPDLLFMVTRLDGSQEIPATGSSARGSAAVTIDRSTLSMRLQANVLGADDSTGAHIHDGYAGSSGSIIVPLEKDPTDPTRWSASGVTLTTDQLDALSVGRLYVNVHTPANPGGEIRGQLLPSGVQVVFSQLSGDQEVPSVASAGSGTAATTVDRRQARVTIHVHASGLDDATASHIHRAERGSNGPVIVPLAQDSSAPGHWFAEDTPVTAEQLADFDASLWYVNVHTPANPSGEIRGQIEPPPPPDTAPPLVALDAVGPSVSGTVSVSAMATDDRAVTRVRFLLNGNELGSDTTEPYAVSWDTTAVANGTVTLAAEAFDAAGNIGESAPVTVTVANMTSPSDTTPPTISLSALPASVSGTVALQATAQDDIGVTQVRFLLNGSVLASDPTAPYSFAWDTTTTSNGSVTVGAEALDAAGNVGTATSQVVTVANVAAATLSELQSSIFTPMCSGCHTGGGSVLPGSMNLSSAAASFASLVGVPSEEQPGVLRVAPNNSAGSYLVRKLAGDPSISGARMPFGGPFLSENDMNKVRSWIDSGAPNN